MNLLLLLLATSLALPQTTSLKGSLEGTVLQAGATTQPVGGARIIVTRVNSATGQPVTIFGYPSGSTFSDAPGTPFPGRGPAPTTPPPPAPPPVPSTVPIPEVLTDRDGRFVVPDLQEGSYRITVRQDGFVKQEYPLLRLPTGQRLKDLVIRIVPAGNINGRLIDNEGRPAVNAPIHLLRATYNAAGQQVFQASGSTRTNDRGEYRLYWITPGRYYLAAGNSSNNAGFVDSANSPNEQGHNYSYTFYPGVAALDRAIAIEVTSGSDLTMDFVAPRQRLYTISGKVVDLTGAASAGLTTYPVTISLAFRSLTGTSGVWTINRSFDPATGTFVLRDVMPGYYILQVAAPPATARIPVEVTNADIDNLVLAVDRGVNVSGRFIVEGGEPSAANALRLQMRPVTGESTLVVGYILNGQAGADGTFAIPNVLPGQYRLGVPPSPDFYVKELRYERRDAFNEAIEVFRTSTDAAAVEIVLSRKVAQVEGTILDERMQPVAGVQAVLIPDRNRNNAALYRTGTTDQNGQFAMHGVAPGDYKVFAWVALESFGYFDPEVVRRAEASGTVVHVEESSKSVVTAKVIP